MNGKVLKVAQILIGNYKWAMSKRKRDLYEVLGIPRNADQDAIKKAYRKKVLKYHPDINKDKETLSLFREADEAYKVLKDEKKRKICDQFGYNAVILYRFGAFK